MPRERTNSTISTARPDDDDAGSDYERRLNRATAARARVEKNRAKRDAKRKQVLAQYMDGISELKGRTEKAHDKYRAQLMRMWHARVARLAHAIKLRDEKQRQIAAKISDVQQLANNLGVRLLDLYNDRCADTCQFEEENARNFPVDKEA
ncbi:hypothetical protein GQ53DRAFT_806294 [Thozetella sp. PMI_491]|nr:hypothetical protein GQ53DRAFT_806294 [Thozetella sp. PMI_491]